MLWRHDSNLEAVTSLRNRAPSYSSKKRFHCIPGHRSGQIVSYPVDTGPRILQRHRPASQESATNITDFASTEFKVSLKLSGYIEPLETNLWLWFFEI